MGSGIERRAFLLVGATALLVGCSVMPDTVPSATDFPSPSSPSSSSPASAPPTTPQPSPTVAVPSTLEDHYSPEVLVNLTASIAFVMDYTWGGGNSNLQLPRKGEESEHWRSVKTFLTEDASLELDRMLADDKDDGEYALLPLASRDGVIHTVDGVEHVTERGEAMFPQPVTSQTLSAPEVILDEADTGGVKHSRDLRVTVETKQGTLTYDVRIHQWLTPDAEGSWLLERWDSQLLTDITVVES